MIQIALLVLSLSAVACSQSRRGDVRRWAPIFGLMSQPLWFWTTYHAGLWGIFACSVAYTGIWARGFYNAWCWRES